MNFIFAGVQIKMPAKGLKASIACRRDFVIFCITPIFTPYMREYANFTANLQPAAKFALVARLLLLYFMTLRHVAPN
jgi:hypothetical protein